MAGHVDIEEIRYMVRQTLSRLTSDSAVDRSLDKKAMRKTDQKPGINRNPDGLKILTVFNAGICKLENALEQIRQMNQRAYKFSLFRGDSIRPFVRSEKIRNVTQVKCFLDKAGSADLIKVLDHCDILVLPTFGFPVAAKVAQLLCDDCESRIIYAALMKGKKVLAVKDGYSDPDIKVAPLLIEEINRVFNKLQEFGVIFCQTGQLNIWCEKMCRNSHKTALTEIDPQKSIEKNNTAGKKLITAQDIEKTVRNNQKEIRLVHKGKVTPLARDLAVEYNINILDNHKNINLS